jgi:hypothetical protein
MSFVRPRGPGVMPIRPFLAGRPFEPETITEMGIALERACAAMRLRDIDDMTTELVAEKIIQLVERGVVGADELCALAVNELTGRE